MSLPKNISLVRIIGEPTMLNEAASLFAGRWSSSSRLGEASGAAWVSL